MLIKILLVVALLIVVFVVVVATRPAKFRVTRSITIAAPPDRIFAKVNDFHAWQAWSPWEGRDPAMQRTYTGSPLGAGAVYGWVGNKDVGEGRMTIEKTDPGAIVIKLEFLKPFAATNTATFTFAPAGAGTAVTWAMEGQNNFMMKAFQMFMNMDKLVGKDFELGLSRLKTVAEKSGA